MAMVTPEEFEAAWPAVGKRFAVCDDDPDSLTNAVVVDVISEQVPYHEKKIAAGRAGGNAKASKLASKLASKTLADGVAIRNRGEERREEEKREELTTNTCASDEARVGDSLFPIPQKEKKPDPRLEWFDQFWEAYWRKVSRKAAVAAFLKCVKNQARLDEVMAAVQSQSAEMLGRSPEKRPHASTWLNQERWNDELIEAATPQRTAMDAALDKIYPRKGNLMISRDKMAASTARIRLMKHFPNADASILGALVEVLNEECGDDVSLNQLVKYLEQNCESWPGTYELHVIAKRQRAERERVLTARFRRPSLLTTNTRQIVPAAESR